ncbi:hypothetical protein Tco_1173224 [Tanacetum coccineum]
MEILPESTSNKLRGRKTQRHLVAVLAVPDISEGRLATKGDATRLTLFFCAFVGKIDPVFDGAFSRDGEEDFVMGEGVIVSSSSLDRSTKSCLGGIMVSLIFLEGFIGMRLEWMPMK